VTRRKDLTLDEVGGEGCKLFLLKVGPVEKKGARKAGG